MASEKIERLLYNGKFKVIHNPTAKGRAPRYKVNDEVPKGVTTILGNVIAKDLLGWAVSCAVEYLKEKLPVITQVDLDAAGKAYTVKRDSGASTGTEAHAMVEAFLKNQELEGEHTQEATNAYEAFVRWFDSTKPVIVNVEEVIYSQEFHYAGTYDAMLEIEGKTYLTDLKTTNSSKKAPRGVYAENFLQLGAYALAHDEQRLFEEANGGSNLLPVEGLMVISCKKNGRLDIVTETDLGLTLEDCKAMFKKVVNLYNFMTYATEQLNV